jgi:GNAT superfamily N-acetyltransferase
MPRRRYVRDTEGRFARVAGAKGTRKTDKATGTPTGKAGLITVEQYPGGKRNSKALQAKLKAEGHSEDSTVVRSFNRHGGGFVPSKRGVGTYNYVARNRKGKVVGTGVALVHPSPARGYSRSVSVGDLFKAPGVKEKNVGKSLMAAMARTAKARDLPKAPAEFGVTGAVDSAKPFYRRIGGRTTPGSSQVDYTPNAYRGVTTKRDKLAGTKVKVKVRKAPVKASAGTKVSTRRKK